MYRRLIMFFFTIVILAPVSPVRAQQIIVLNWDNVVSISQQNNLEIKIETQRYQSQEWGTWSAFSDFIPTVGYRFQAIRNIERPEFVVPGIGRIRFGTEYNYAHILELQWPVFTGGARWYNWKISQKLERSLRHELDNKEQSVVFDALQAYFNLMLANSLIDVNQRSVDAAQANFEQVQKFYNVGTASQLDLLRAKSQYTAALPGLTSARNGQQVAEENLKFILNIPPGDSLVVVDTLRELPILEPYKDVSLEEMKAVALKERPDLKSAELRMDITGDRSMIALGRFLPTLALGANVQHQAQIETRDVSQNDYVRSKSVALTLQWPLFEGAGKIFEYQQARVDQRQAEYQLEYFRDGILLEVETAFTAVRNARTNLTSLRDAVDEAREALRLASLNYQEGIITQVDVLAAQLAFTNNELNYQEGIFRSIVSQLRLMKSVGKLDLIWTAK